MTELNEYFEYFQNLSRIELDVLNSSLNLSRLSGMLSNAQLQKYHRDGFLIVNDALTADIISGLNRACDNLDKIVENAVHSYEDFNLESESGGWTGQDGATPSYRGKIRKIKNLIDHSEAFREAILDQDLLRIVYSLLGSEFKVHSKGFWMNKPGGGQSSEKPWHQDSAYFQDGEAEIVTVWFPLKDVNTDNGCLYAIPKSHLQGKIQHIGEEAQLELEDRILRDAIPLEMKAGSIALFNQNTIHYSGVNSTHEDRRAIIFRYYAKKYISNNQGNASGVSLGGGISESLTEGVDIGRIEKIHLITNRVLREQANAQGIRFIDVGTDYHYPFYADYTPTRMALMALGEHAESSLHYPSSYGLLELRDSFKNFMKSQFGVHLDRDTEIMITTGASQTIDALSRTFNGKYVLLPELSLPTVSTISRANGAEFLRLPITSGSGFIDISKAEEIVSQIGGDNIRFLYLNSPCNPNGKVASKEYLEELVELCNKHGVLIFHDMDSWYTRHSDAVRLTNILEIPRAIDCSVTNISLSKEFGLAGLRIGLVAGNAYIIDLIREHNSTYSVMIPEPNQHAALSALNHFRDDEQRARINRYVTSVLYKSIEGWKSLGWPDSTILYPSAGYKFLLEVPPGIEAQEGFPAITLFDYYVASRAYVKLSTSRSFNPQNNRYVRMILMQDLQTIDEIFSRLNKVGVNYGMTLPKTLGKEYSSFLRSNNRGDF